MASGAGPRGAIMAVTALQSVNRRWNGEKWNGWTILREEELVSFGQSASKFYRTVRNLGPAPSTDSVAVDKSQTLLEMVSSSAKWG